MVVFSEKDSQPTQTKTIPQQRVMPVGGIGPEKGG